MDARLKDAGAASTPPSAPGPSAPTPAAVPATGGGRPSTPAGRFGFRARLVAHLRESVWTPVALKAVTIAAGMVALAAIGAASTLAGGGISVSVAAPAPAGAAALQSAWLAPVAPSPHEPPAAPSAAPAPARATDATPSGTPSSAGRTADGKVILNTATAEDLQKLPRVGAKRAQAILDLRKRLGKFRQPTDLLRVRGIGRKSLRLMLPLLIVDPPPPPPPSDSAPPPPSNSAPSPSL